MKKNLKVLLMLVFVAFSLSCASTSDIKSAKTNADGDAIVKQQENHAKLKDEKEEVYVPRRLPSFDW